jgi:hypothetical protein
VSRRAPIGLVALLIVGLGLSITAADAPCNGATSIAPAHGYIGAGPIDWTIDAPEFDAPSAIAYAPPARAIVTRATHAAPIELADRTNVLRFAPKTSPPPRVVTDAA